jgi:hypothetical protein
MCYSFEASLLAGAGLAVAGVNMVRKSLRLDRKMLVFAVFPLVFSTHQLIEAVVWRSIEHPFAESVYFRYAYVAIAFLAWPVLAPLAALYAEKQPERKGFWRFLLACGVGLALYIVAKLLASSGVDAFVTGHSIQYEVAYDQEPPPLVAITYVAITMLSFLLVDNKMIKIVGVAMLAACFYSIFKMRAVWYSVWCMSAAVFSLLFALAIRGEETSSAHTGKSPDDSSAVLQ